jgi:hypothetical protein
VKAELELDAAVLKAKDAKSIQAAIDAALKVGGRKGSPSFAGAEKVMKAFREGRRRRGREGQAEATQGRWRTGQGLG